VAQAFLVTIGDARLRTPSRLFSLDQAIRPVQTFGSELPFGGYSVRTSVWHDRSFRGSLFVIIWDQIP